MSTTTESNEAPSKALGSPFLLILSKVPLKAIWTTAIIIVLATAGGWYAYYRSTQTVTENSSVSELQTAVVTKGDLIIYASGTGTLISSSETEEEPE